MLPLLGALRRFYPDRHRLFGLTSGPATASIGRLGRSSCPWLCVRSLAALPQHGAKGEPVSTVAVAPQGRRPRVDTAVPDFGRVDDRGAADDVGMEDYDLVEVAEDGQGEEEDSSAGSARSKQDIGPLARKMWSCACLGNRADWVWAKFSQRVILTSSFLGHGDVALIMFAMARIKYRDPKVVDVLSPFMLRYIEDFTTTHLVLLLNAHKKLEMDRMDNIHLLLQAICNRQQEWTGRHVALSANAVAHFYIYEPRFWKGVAATLPTLVWTMNSLELTNLVSAMARVDRRDGRALVKIARMCRRCAARNLFNQATLATTMNAFAKLDFNHPKLSRVFLNATMNKVERALELGPSYRVSALRKNEEDVFDVQALVRVLHTLVCLVGAPDDIVEKLLTLISWSTNEVSDYQRRVLKTVGVVLVYERPDLYARLQRDVKAALYTFEKTPVQVSTYESRWGRELRGILEKMDVVVEKKHVVDDQVLDILLPTSHAVVMAVGPYGYYSGSTNRTAYSKLHQRLLEMRGYKCLVVPYFEWKELKTVEDKMVYLWSLGRRAAAGDVDAAESAPAVVEEDITTQTDLEDAGSTAPTAGAAPVRL